MKENVTVRFRHPYQEEKFLTMELPRSTPFSALTPMLLEREFVEPQKGGFRFLILGHLCTDTHPIGDYMPASAGQVEIWVYPFAQIMV